MPSEYLNFDLLIEHGPSSVDYRARVIRSPAGEASVDFALPFMEDELSDFLGHAVDSTRHYGVELNEIVPPLDPRAFGIRLYNAAFAGSVGLCLRRSLDEAERLRSGLRIRLRLNPAVLDLAELPWEFLYATDLGRFLALSDLTPIVRYIEQDRAVQPLLAELPLTVLAVVSNPTDVTALAVEQEWQHLQDALNPLVQRGVIVLERLEAATLAALQARLRRGPVDLLHFVGHGFFDPQSDTGGLVFENENGRSESATAETLGMLLHDHQALRLIFLNACQGAQGGRHSAFAGVAQRLVQQGAPAVLAMQFPVTDAAAIALSQAFYQALADGLPADSALSQARKAIAARGNASEWGTPVLFSRSDDNRFFDLLDVLPPPPCPYPGMVPFHAEDARFFYGREDEIEQMLRHLRHQRQLYVIGPSGSGKSSLIAAGLLPKLSSTPQFPAGYWLVYTMRPGARPLEALGATTKCDISQPVEVVANLLAANAPAQRLLLVIDQFEELFSLADADERRRFITLLQQLRKMEDCVLLIAMRADYYPDLMNSDLWPVDNSQRMDITALRGDALRRAIYKPASEVEVEIEDALVERLMADAADEPGVLPMLQETLQLLWARMSRRRITLQNYEQLGDGKRSGLSVAIATKADATLSELTSDEQDVARRIFLRLIQFSQGRDDTRRQLSEPELRNANDDPATVDLVIRQLTSNRLLTVSGEEGGERLVDISHERLIIDWPRLREWVDQHKDAEQIRRRLEAKAQEWVRLGRGEGGLLDEAELEDVDTWLATSSTTNLGASGDMLLLLEMSRRSINPGWHRLGSVVLSILILASASMFGLAALKTEEITSNALRLTSWVVLGGLVISLIVLSGAVRRRYTYWGQRLTHQIAGQRWSQLAIFLLALGASAFWFSVGSSAAENASQCSELGLTRPRGNATHIGILKSDEIDPYFLGIVKDILAGKDRVQAWIVEPSEAQTCAGYFSKILTVRREQLPTNELALTATIVNLPPQKDVRRSEDCAGYAFLAHKVVQALQLQPDEVLLEEQAQRLDLCRPYQLNEEGVVARNSGNYLEAERNFQDAISLAPGYATAHSNLGYVLLIQKSYPEAVSEFRKALELKPNNLVIMLNLGTACYIQGPEQYKCAEESFRSIIDSEQAFPDGRIWVIRAHLGLSTVYRDQGRHDDAEKILKEVKTIIDEIPDAKEQAPYQMLWYIRHGALLYEERRWDDAINELEVAMSMQTSPSSLVEELTYYLASAYQAQGDTIRACELWTQYDLTPSGGSPTEDVRRAGAVQRKNSISCTLETS